mmetsp:Transcript_46417/g.86746  ORF Transcript_46417/g.86746 Transcript_46417/m.86746 type:complete len:84 (+) Transcript_46417:876-1127(+)
MRRVKRTVDNLKHCLHVTTSCIMPSSPFSQICSFANLLSFAFLLMPSIIEFLLVALCGSRIVWASPPAAKAHPLRAMSPAQCG